MNLHALHMISKLINVSIGASDMEIEKDILIHWRSHWVGVPPLCGKCDVEFNFIYTNRLLQNFDFIYAI